MRPMSRRAACAASVLFAVLLAIVSVPLASAAGSAAAPTGAKLMGDLPAVLDAAGPGERIPVYFVLADQLEGDALRARVAALTAGAAPPAGAAGKAARRQATVSALREHATQAQAGLLAALRALEAQGAAARVRPLWIGNVVGADLAPDAVRALAARPEVVRVNWNPKRDVFLGARASAGPSAAPAGWRARYGLSPLAPAGTDGPGIDALECGVVKMRAPEVWNELGNTGAGAVIAVIDTGVCWTHPDIANQIWVNPGEDLNHNGVVMDAADMNGVDNDGNGFIDDLIGWNFDLNTNQPTDENSHGSHCAGTVAGDGTGGSQSGMAPDAKIMAVRVGVNFSDEVDVWNAMQYAAANGADAISMSLGWPHGQNPDRPTWRTNCENTINAGTAMVIAAGNEGQGAEPDNVRTPGDVPRVITVGATDCSDVAAGFSSRGPVTWQGIAPWNDWPWPPGLVKPDISAPGVDTLSHDVCSGYSYKSGTSMATPHVAGAVALIVAANPGLEHDDIKALLEETSVDLGEPGKDNTYGTGRVDVYEAVLLSGSRDGRIAVKEQAVRCGGSLNVTVSDTDLKNFGTIQVTAVSTTETAPESITLTETNPGSGAFKGVVPIGGGAPQADGVVQAADGDTVTVTYVDADNGAGGLNVPKSDSAPVDCSTPRISGVSAEPTMTYGAIIRWTTDEASDSLVDYGKQIPPDRSTLNGAPTTQHQVTLTGLEQCTIYRYRVSSTDRVGNKATDDNGGAYYYFEVMGDFGQGPQSCHAGKTTLDRAVYSCADTATLEVSDMDLNLDPGAIDGGDAAGHEHHRAGGRMDRGDGDRRQQLALPRNRRDCRRGARARRPAPARRRRHPDGQLPRRRRRRRQPPLDAMRPRSPTAPAPASRTFGSTPSPTRARRSASRRTSRRARSSSGARRRRWVRPRPARRSRRRTTMLLNDFSSCQRAYVRVRVTDEHGYETVADNLGTPHAFSLGLIPGLYWKESFEGSTAGWTLGGEWQVGAPQGEGRIGRQSPRPDQGVQQRQGAGTRPDRPRRQPGGLRAEPHREGALPEPECDDLAQHQAAALPPAQRRRRRRGLALAVRGPGPPAVPQHRRGDRGRLVAPDLRHRVAGGREAGRLARVQPEVGRVGPVLRLERRRDRLQGRHQARLRTLRRMQRGAHVQRGGLGAGQQRLRRRWGDGQLDCGPGLGYRQCRDLRRLPRHDTRLHAVRRQPRRRRPGRPLVQRRRGPERRALLPRARGERRDLLLRPEQRGAHGRQRAHRAGDEHGDPPAAGRDRIARGLGRRGQPPAALLERASRRQRLPHLPLDLAAPCVVRRRSATRRG